MELKNGDKLILQQSVSAPMVPGDNWWLFAEVKDDKIFAENGEVISFDAGHFIGSFNWTEVWAINGKRTGRGHAVKHIIESMNDPWILSTGKILWSDKCGDINDYEKN